MERPIIVGAEPDYDQLMNVGAEARPQTARGYAPQPGSSPQGTYGTPPGYPPQGYAPAPYYPQQQYAPAPPPQTHPQQRYVTTQAPMNSRDFPVGFTRNGILPGENAELEVKPQVIFKGKRLAVAHSNASRFVILDIKVGKNSQLAATGEMSAEAFSSQAVGTQMELDTASPGITITLVVRNISSTTENFYAVLYGAVME